MTNISHTSKRFIVIKTELEEVRQIFMALLSEVLDADWDRKLPGETWTAKDEMVHIVQALEVLPKGINRAVGGGDRSFL